VGNATLRPLYPRGKKFGTHCTGGMGESQNRSGFVRRISASPRFDPTTVEPVASRYTADAVPATHETIVSPSIYLAKNSNCKNTLYICSLEQDFDNLMFI